MGGERRARGTDGKDIVKDGNCLRDEDEARLSVAWSVGLSQCACAETSTDGCTDWQT